MDLQLRLMDVAGDAQTLGAAMNHASLNIANALGAWLGGLVIAAGYGYRSPLRGRRRCCRWPGSRCWRWRSPLDRAGRPLRGRHVVEGQVDAAVAHLRAVPLDAVQPEAGRLDDARDAAFSAAAKP